MKTKSKEVTLNPKQKWLIQDGGHIYPWTEALAARKDMRPYDPERKGIATEPTATEKRVPIELQGKTFLVEDHSVETVVLTKTARAFTRRHEKSASLGIEAGTAHGTKHISRSQYTGITFFPRCETPPYQHCLLG